MARGRERRERQKHERRPAFCCYNYTIKILRGADTFTENLFSMRKLDDFIPPSHAASGSRHGEPSGLYPKRVQHPCFVLAAFHARSCLIVRRPGLTTIVGEEAVLYWPCIVHVLSGLAKRRQGLSPDVGSAVHTAVPL